MMEFPSWDQAEWVGMLFLLIAGIVVYVAAGLAFFIFSVSEMIETGKGGTAKILFAALYSAFWPVTLVGVSIAIIAMRSFRRFVFTSG